MWMKPRGFSTNRSRKSKTEESEPAAEKVIYFVIPSKARNLSLIEAQAKRASSARCALRNDKNLDFSAGCEEPFRVDPNRNTFLYARRLITTSLE
jgi:hypothetical protein